MHSIARESLQSYLYSYKQTPKEAGLELVRDERVKESERKRFEERNAILSLQQVINGKVAFAVHAHQAYDGSLEDESPYYRKTVSFENNDFLHIYKRFSPDWWLGRVVSAGSTIGFIPTAKRLARLTTTTKGYMEEKEGKKKGIRRVQSELWECPSAYTVVPSTRPILLMGPSLQQSRLTQLMHAAVRSEIVKRFGSRVRRLSSDIGARGHTQLEYDSPAQLDGLNLAPIVILFRIRNRKILIKLLKKSGITSNADLAGADALNALLDDQVDLVIEDNGLPEATAKICNHLENYWKALHPDSTLMEPSVMDMVT